MLQSYLHSRYDALREAFDRRGPDLTEGPALVDELYRHHDLLDMTFFDRHGATVLLHDIRAGEILISGESKNKSFAEFLESTAVKTEILLEVLIAVIGGLFFSGAAHNENLKQVVKKTATEVVSNPSVSRVLKALIELLTTNVNRYNMKVRLRELLKELFDLISGELAEMLKRIFAGLSWWDVAVMIFDLLVCFTPLGWAKRAVSLMSPFVGLTVTLGIKYQKFQEGVA